VPESPRWLFIHGREEEAEKVVREIEQRVREDTGEELSEPDESITVRQRRTIPLHLIVRSVGRKPMIAGTYILSGGLLVVTAFLFKGGELTAVGLVVALMCVFFFASAGVSAAYLTVSEIFPLETRALCIAVSYAIGTGTGGAIGPLLFANLIESGKASHVFVGFMIGAVAMILGGVAEILFGVKAERRSLESIAKPLTAQDADGSTAAPASATAA
jgi:MFS family permease